MTERVQIVQRPDTIQGNLRSFNCTILKLLSFESDASGDDNKVWHLLSTSLIVRQQAHQEYCCLPCERSQQDYAQGMQVWCNRAHLCSACVSSAKTPSLSGMQHGKTSVMTRLKILVVSTCHYCNFDHSKSQMQVQHWCSFGNWSGRLLIHSRLVNWRGNNVRACPLCPELFTWGFLLNIIVACPSCFQVWVDARKMYREECEGDILIHAILDRLEECCHTNDSCNELCLSKNIGNSVSVDGMQSK